MTVITRSLDLPPGNLRPFDARRDLRAVADLVEVCFAGSLDADGRRYIEQLRHASRSPAYLRWTTGLAAGSPTSLSGFVWEEHGRVVGNLSLIPFTIRGRRCFLIANVAVAPSHRRHGIARSLTEAAVEHAQQRGVSAIWLHVRQENTAAFQLYSALGFHEQVRRSTWEGGEGLSMFTSQGKPPEGVAIVRGRTAHWSAQRAWLEHLYPPEIRWYLPFNLNVLRCDWWGGLYRFLTGEDAQSWVVLSGERLLGLLTWQPLRGHADCLWLATTHEREETVIRALVPFVCRYIAEQRRLVLDYPAGLGQSLQEVGFRVNQTLIWMELRANV